jgi:hypothetical protein
LQPPGKRAHADRKRIGRLGPDTNRRLHLIAHVECEFIKSPLLFMMFQHFGFGL